MSDNNINSNLNNQDYLYVIAQFIVFGLFLFELIQYHIAFPQWLRNIGFIIVILGILLCLIALLQINKHISPFPAPKSDSRLITNGVFTYIRHPIYSGILLGLIGYALYAASVYKLIIALVLLILFYFKSNYEERRLSIAFPTYDAYKATTKKFIPFFF